MRALKTWRRYFAYHTGIGLCHSNRLLARPAAEITFRDVIEAVEGPYQMVRCMSEETPCNRGASDTCAFRKVFCAITHDINRQLEAANFAAILEK